MATLAPPTGASLVKGIPFEVSDPAVSGPDIFGRIVPMEAHEASSLYSEEKAQLLRGIAEEIEEADASLAVFLSGICLDEVPEPGQYTGKSLDLSLGTKRAGRGYKR